MHQSGDGSRSLHRVRKPDVERELRTLPHASAEHADTGDEQKPMAVLMFRVAAQLSDFRFDCRVDCTRLDVLPHDIGYLLPGRLCNHAERRRETIVTILIVEQTEHAGLNLAVPA